MLSERDCAVDTHTFDRWTRGLGVRLDRRRAGGLAATVASSMLLTPSTDAKKKKKKKKKQGDTCAAVGQKCESDAACCDQSGKVICEMTWDDRPEKENCSLDTHCCGTWGAPCTSHCDCCGYIQCRETSTGPNCGGVVV